MAVLASRKHYCTNDQIRGKDNLDEHCKLLLKNREGGCPEFKNVHKVKGHPSMQKGGCHEAHDIEDLVKVGQVVKGCSYFAARSMAEDAQIVFCPYSYILNPVIRRAMEVDVKGAIIILDEAHNIEDMARDAGSVSVEEDALLQLHTELGQLSVTDAMIYQPLYEMAEEIISWIERRKGTLEKREFQHYFHCWTGDKALRELQEANISQQCFPILQECATKAIKAASDAEPEIAHLSGMAAITLEGLFSSLSYFFSGNGIHVFDYQLALQRYVKRDAVSTPGGWTHTLSLWCLNPAVVFRDIADLSLSVVLTSGTLSPMNSFSSELGVQFGTCLEAPHVIDVESQLLAGVISTGPSNYPLNASYKTADGYTFQDALGTSLEEIYKIVPGGCLVFFPSYKLMEKLCNRWRETGQWSRLNARKTLFVEPRGGNIDDFEPVLKGYYNSIRQGNKPTFGRKRRGKKLDLSSRNGIECSESLKKDGAAFLAVCRGKVSEGIDFSDEYARAVIIVGIPFPNINDIRVAQKKKYNDTYKSSKNLLSGNEWYCHQAFRALNQAAGRCIRHRFDYGAVILLDERFREERNITYISKWLRKSIRQYDNFEQSMEGLKSFFSDVKERIGKETVNVLQYSDVNVEDIPCTDQSNWHTRKKIQKVNKSNRFGQKAVSNYVMATERTAQLCQSPNLATKSNASFAQEKSLFDIDVQVLASTCRKDIRGCREYIDLEGGSEDLSCSRALPMTLFPDDPEMTIVKETPGMDGSIAVTSPGSFSREENSSSTVIQAPTEYANQLSLSAWSFANSSTAPKFTRSLVFTPDRDVTAKAKSSILETESFLNLSVNSHTQKRRKPLGSPSADFVQAEQLGAPDTKSMQSVDFSATSMATRDARLRIEFACETNDGENMLKESKVPQSLSMSNCGASFMSPDPVLDKRLQIFCGICKNPLGLPENHLLVTCVFTSSSKVHLANLSRGTSESLAINTSMSVHVVICNVSSINQQLCNRSFDGAQGQGIWCKEDGCVFNTIFCPFCDSPNNCLGVQVVAADALNVQLLDKILFYLDRLEIKNIESSDEKDWPTFSGSNIGKSAVYSSIEKFSFVPENHKSGGWRTTKSKMRLPKRGLLSTSDG